MPGPARAVSLRALTSAAGSRSLTARTLSSTVHLCLRNIDVTCRFLKRATTIRAKLVLNLSSTCASDGPGDGSSRALSRRFASTPIHGPGRMVGRASYHSLFCNRS
jgi:hypothetical protein